MMVSNLPRLINRFVCFLNTLGLHCAHALFSPSNQSPILIGEKNGGEGVSVYLVVLSCARVRIKRRTSVVKFR